MKDDTTPNANRGVKVESYLWFSLNKDRKLVVFVGHKIFIIYKKIKHLEFYAVYKKNKENGNRIKIMKIYGFK